MHCSRIEDYNNLITVKAIKTPSSVSKIYPFPAGNFYWKGSMWRPVNAIFKNIIQNACYGCSGALYNTSIRKVSSQSWARFKKIGMRIKWVKPLWKEWKRCKYIQHHLSVLFPQTKRSNGFCSYVRERRSEGLAQSRRHQSCEEKPKCSGGSRVSTAQRTVRELSFVAKMQMEEVKLLNYVCNTYSVPNAKEIVLDLHTLSTSSCSKKLSMIHLKMHKIIDILPLTHTHTNKYIDINIDTNINWPKYMLSNFNLPVWV